MRNGIFALFADFFFEFSSAVDSASPGRVKLLCCALAESYYFCVLFFLFEDELYST